jgi:Clp amino terminal domain, pathogenicity island component
MTLDDAILGEAKAAREAVLELERQQEHAKVDYHHQIRRLHAAGGSLREIADALGLSHQRVHQIVGEEIVEMRFPVPGSAGVRVRDPRRGKRRRGFFTRFSEQGRDAVTRAQHEARALKHNYVGTEHIVLGLLADEGAPAEIALRALGVTHARVRDEVLREVGEGSEAVAGEVAFTKRAKKSLELALREALRLGDNYIGSEHVLLGVVRAKDSLGAKILAGLGADADAVEAAVDAV